MAPQYFFPSGEDTVEEYVANLVQRCRQDSTKHPRDEPCRFCGNICASWKKLTAHLAKHMEQITMPVINLVEGKSSGDDYRFANQMQTDMLSMMPYQQRPSEVPQFFDEPAEIDPLSLPMAPMQNHQASYPPSNLTVGLENQLLPPQNAFDPVYPQFLGASYPPLMVTNRSRAASFNDAQQGLSVSRQGTTFPPSTMPRSGPGSISDFDQSGQTYYF